VGSDTSPDGPKPSAVPLPLRPQPHPCAQRLAQACVRRTNASVSEAAGVPGVEQAPVGDGGAEAVATRDIDKLDVPH
jgi:hypothetical protein